MSTRSRNDAERKKREQERLLREANRARCAACGKKVGIEDRCQDGLYLHRLCADQNSMRRS